jgi:TPR repeat protein
MTILDTKNRTIDEAFDAYERSHYKLAVKIFRSFAEAGNAQAQLMLGLMYVQGK